MEPKIQPGQRGFRATLNGCQSLHTASIGTASSEIMIQTMQQVSKVYQVPLSRRFLLSSINTYALKRTQAQEGTMAPFRTRHQTFNNTKILYPPKTNWCYSPFDKSEVGRRNSKEYTHCFWWPVTWVTGLQRARDNKNPLFFGCLSPKPRSVVFSGQQECNLNRDRL